MLLYWKEWLFSLGLAIQLKADSSLKIRLLKGFLLNFSLNLWFLCFSLQSLSRVEILVWMSTSWKIHNDFFWHGGEKVEVLDNYVCSTAFFLPCKENVCWKPHLFYCSIIEVSFSYKVYVWTDYRKIIKKSCHIKNNPKHWVI